MSTPVCDLPATREATSPPEARGLARDEVRLLVARALGDITHTRFTHLADHLEPGELLVVNDSATLPAAVDGRHGEGDDRSLTVHFSGPLPGDRDFPVWVVELRSGPHADGPVTDAVACEHARLPDGARLTLLGSYPSGARTSSRLWAAHVDVDDVASYLSEHGRPITYSYVDRAWPLADYQTVFATKPGSAEMPSAARPFTPAVLRDLVRRGVFVATVTLHTGVSSPEAGEPPIPERYDVPAATADLVNLTRWRGRRVVAVGTTVTRALETVASPDGVVGAGSGVTDLVLGPSRPARVVTGLVTGWHAPGASHLSLLEAVAGYELVSASYDEAVANGYLWHEFGDSCLLLP
jgi:S-adenosylmethionine:tRNA ribosyltransferase-isomerase